MKMFDGVVAFVQAVLLANFSSLDVAEVLLYDWNGAHPRPPHQGWTELWGDPYSVRFNTGEHTVEGGWLEVLALQKFIVSCIVTGTNVSSAGAVDFIFEAKNDLQDSSPTAVQEGLSIQAMADGETEVTEVGILDVSDCKFIRLKTVVNEGAQPVICRAITNCAVLPVQEDPDWMY